MDRGRGNADGLCAMFDGSSQCTIVLPVKCLGYGLVVPFLAYRQETKRQLAPSMASSTRHRQLRHRPSRGRGAYQAGGTPWASAWVVRGAGSMCALGVRGIGAECAAERVRGEDGAPNASNSTSLPETEGK
eukprot:scaffold91411_cov54-Phaeocystis_antarctica.AAC.2